VICAILAPGIGFEPCFSKISCQSRP